MNDLAKDTFANVSLLIRVVASGLVSYGLLLLIDAENKLGLLTMLQSDRGVWLALAGAALSGVCAYALYMGLFESLFLWPVIFWIRCFPLNKIPDSLRCMNTPNLIELLYRERKARYTATDVRVKELQNRVDTFYAWLVFLYCLID